jgi:glycosyltransferase involved in cell wall biosynthesis
MTEHPPREPMAQAPLSLILVASQSAVALDATLDGWHAELATLAPTHEIIIVEDAASDSIRQLAEAWCQLHPNSRILPQSQPGGIGACLRDGLAAARYPLVAYCLGSAGYHPADLKSMLAVIDEVDLVTGIRARAGKRIRLPLKEHLYRWLVRLVFGVRLKDVDCPFKLFRRTIFSRIPIQSAGGFVHAEILAKANFLGCLMTELPVEVDTAAPAPIDLRERRAEALRVFRNADFGPTFLPAPAEQPSDQQPSIPDSCPPSQ